MIHEAVWIAACVTRAEHAGATSLHLAHAARAHAPFRCHHHRRQLSVFTTLVRPALFARLPCRRGGYGDAAPFPCARGRHPKRGRLPAC